jgi:hypothetical protein
MFVPCANGNVKQVDEHELLFVGIVAEIMSVLLRRLY